MTPDELEYQARRQFLERLTHHLMNDPYWVKVIGTGTRQQRRQLGHEISVLVTTIPKVHFDGMPNRQVRRAILKEVGKTDA